VHQELPTGTVTFLFTDVEGSTRLLHELGAEAYARRLAAHRKVIREACARITSVDQLSRQDAQSRTKPHGSKECAPPRWRPKTQNDRGVDLRRPRRVAVAACNVADGFDGGFAESRHPAGLSARR
jgi:hypothetical protein